MKNQKTYNLRITPELTIILNDESFEIIDLYDRENSGVYPFKRLKYIELKKQKINWLFSIFSWTLDLFTAISEGGVYRDKASLLLNLTDLKLKLCLNESNFKEAERLVATMKLKIDYN